MLKKHCSEEQLIAHLDNELAPALRDEVEEHLSLCWKCRGRRADLENGIHRVSQALDRSTYPPPNWTDRTRRRLLAEMAAQETNRSISFPSSRPALRSWQGPLRIAAALAASVALCVSVYTYWFERDMQVRAHSQIERFVQSDLGLGQQSLHQVMLLELREPNARTAAKELRVEVWSDPAAHRHAIRLHDAGELVHAAWKSSAQVWGSSPGFTDTSRTATPLPNLLETRWTPQEAETQLIAWMGANAWKPLRFAPDMRAFAQEHGSEVGLDVPSPHTIRLRASRARNQITTQWSVDMDTRTNRPQSQTIRWQKDGAVMELRVVTEQEELVAGIAIPPDVFTNPMAEAIATLPLPVQPQPTATELYPSAPTSEQLTESAIRIEFLLHHLPADWTRALEIQEAENVIVVRGVTESENARAVIEAEVNDIAWTRTALQSLDALPAISPLSTEDGALSVAPEPAVESVFPLEKELAAHFVAHAANKDEAAKQLAAFSLRAAQLAAELRAETWALQRLDERFPAERLALASASVQREFSLVRQQRQTAIKTTTAALRAIVLPVFGPLHQKLAQANQITDIGDSNAADAVDDKAATGETTISAASAIDDRIRALLAGGTQLDASPGDALGRVLHALDFLQNGRPDEITVGVIEATSIEH